MAIDKAGEKSSWVIGGSTLIGVGVGFVFLVLYQSALLLVASIIIGVGLGLVLGPVLSKRPSERS